MVRMPKTVLLLLGVILYLCVVLVRIENQRYALWMGLCHESLSGRRQPIVRNGPQLSPLTQPARGGTACSLEAASPAESRGHSAQSDSHAP